MPNAPLKKSRPIIAFVVVFFLSGAAGLAYQMLWAKAFVATIGGEFPAVLAVVTAFMAGIALGNVFIARFRTIPAHTYGVLEVIIGLWALATSALIPSIEPIISKFLGPHPSPSFHWFIVFTAVLLCLLPATVAMGATLPAAERFVTTGLRQQSTGLIYGANTAGAALGCIAAAFWLMPAFGIRNSLFAFAVLDLVCGLLALWIARGQEVISPLAPSQQAPVAKLFFAGLLGIGFEVLLIRALSHVLENTVYTFAVVLAVYLAGNALGAFLANRRIPARCLRLDWLFAALSIVCLAAAISLRWSPAIYIALRNLFGDSLPSVAFAEAITASIYFFIPSILMGAVWTLLTQATLDRKSSLAWAVAINTSGAAVAPIFFGVLALPIAGLQAALALLPIGYAFLAAKKRLSVPLCVVALAAIPALTSVRNLIDHEGFRILSLQEGMMGSVAVLEAENNSRLLKFNNRFQMGGTAARAAEERQATVPLLLHPSPQRALFLGLGTGITFAAAANFQSLRGDGVEIVPEIATVMPLFNPGHELQSTNLRVHIADARRFVRATAQSYDVIVADLFHPAQDAAGFLYTLEHFTAIRQRLAPNGLFCQWLPIYQMDLATLRIVSSTFARVFPHTELWLLRLNLDVPVIGLIGRLTPSHYAPDYLESRFEADPILATHAKQLGLGDSLRLLGNYIGSVTPSEGTPVNTDLNPILIFTAPEITFRKEDDPGARLLNLIGELQSAPRSILAAASNGFGVSLESYIRARDIYLRGLHTEGQGNRTAAVAAYIESSRISPDFTSGYAQAIVIATAIARENPAESRTILEKLIEAQPSRPVARELLRRIENTANLSN